VAGAAALLVVLVAGGRDGSPPGSDVAATSLVSPGGGPVYYVAGEEPGAGDANNGLYPTYRGGEDGPWLTLQHAADIMSAGATTYVRAGVYHESGITFAATGRAEAPITLAGYPGEEAIVDGSGAEGLLPGIGIAEGQGYYTIQALTIRHMTWSGIATDPASSVRFPGIVIRDCILYANGWSGIDLAAAVVANRHSRRPVVTAAIDEMSFLAPIEVGQLAEIDARITLVDHSSMEIRVDVQSEDLLSGERRHTSTAYVTFVALDPVTRRPTPVPPLVLESEDERQEHARAQERRHRRLERRTAAAARRP